MRIKNHDTAERILIVAEIGNNHEGRFDVAKQLVERAAECKVDAVKFQTFRTKYFVSQRDPARFKRLSSFELSFDQFAELQRLAHALGLLFISTPLDLESARFLGAIVDAYKIASGDNDFRALIEATCRTDKPVVISSGLTDLAQIRGSFQIARDAKAGAAADLAVLHCVSSYPAPPTQVNLQAIALLRETLGCTVGYSDHTMGSEACLAAAALGAQILEKHFTLDHRYSDFRDHQLSADPTEMSNLVVQVRRIEELLGDRAKIVQPCETEVRAVARRSIVAATDLLAGRKLCAEDLTWLRPGDGLSPGEEHRLLGGILKRDVSFGELITPADLV